jgi:hypothetical protein
MDNWIRPEFFCRSIAKKVGRFRITEKAAEPAFSSILLLSRLSGWRPFEMWDEGR